MDNETLLKNVNESIYRVYFSDKSHFNGGTFESPGWAKCVSENIISLELFLPNGKDIIKLENYQRYNFFIGARKPLMSSNSILLGHMYGLGCNDGIVTSYRITIISPKGDKYKVGDITVRKFPFGKEGVGRTSTSGWKMGAK